MPFNNPQPDLCGTLTTQSSCHQSHLSTQIGRAGQPQAHLCTMEKGSHSRVKEAQIMGRMRAPNGFARPVDLIVYEDQKPSLWAKLADLGRALVLPSLMETDPIRPFPSEMVHSL